MSYYNPFQGKELKFPRKYEKQVEGYCQTRPGGGKKPSLQDSPFPRQVDLWFLAVCMGMKKNRRVKEKNSYRFITGEVLANNPEKIEMLEIMAISTSKDPYIIGKPDKIVEMANEFAAAGIFDLLVGLKTGKDLPLWNLTEYFYDFLS